MHGELDEAVGEAAGTGSLVAHPGAATQRCQGHPERGPADRVEHAVQGEPAVLAGGELERAGVDRIDVLGEHRGGIGGMASVLTVLDEAADRVLEGKLEEGTLVKALPGARRGTLHAREQGEMGEPDPALLEGGDTGGEQGCRLPGGDRTSRGGAGHPALVADPVDRGVRALDLVLIGGRERRSLMGEAELEEVNAVAEAGSGARRARTR